MPICEFCGCNDYVQIDTKDKLGIECSKCKRGHVSISLNDRALAEKLWEALGLCKSCIVSKGNV